MKNITPSIITDDKAVLRVLIVEDCETDYLILLRHLQKNLPGAMYHRAEHRAQLISALALQWDFIITDYHLLDIEGAELLTVITAASGNTPCILLSGSIAELDKTKTPDTICAKLEKGDFMGLRDVLHKLMSSMGKALNK